MAGIYERVKKAATLERCSAHLFDAALTLYGTGDFTSTQVLNAINDVLANDLAGAEVTDLTNIRAQMDAQGTTTLKLVYTAKVRAAVVAAEMGNVTDAQFRTILGIA